MADDSNPALSVRGSKWSAAPLICRVRAIPVATAATTQQKSTAVAAASEDASTNVQTVASAAEDLSASIS